MPRRGECSRCGKPVYRGPTSRPEIICHECRRELPAPRLSTPAYQPKPCEQCREMFTPQPRTKGKPPQRFCSASCRSTWVNFNVTHASKPKLTPEQKLDLKKTRALTKARKRRLRLNAVPWDGTTEATILDRDKWKCRMPICLFGSRRIYKTRTYPDPRSPSVDHILPLSVGGDDTQWNKRAAHLGCNMARSNNPDDQMPLPFGADQDAVARYFQPRQPRLCTICNEPLPTGKYTCSLHRPVWFIECTVCGRPVTCHGHVRKRSYCGRLYCMQEVEQTTRLQSYLTRREQYPGHLRGLEAQSMHDEGMTWDEIADRLGYSRGTSAAVAAIRATGQRSKTRTIPYERQPRLEQTIRTAGGKYAG